MNQNLKELVNTVGTDISGKWVRIDNVEQLAELIIFECVKLAVFKGDSATGQAIKEHFGVKE